MTGLDSGYTSTRLDAQRLFSDDSQLFFYASRQTMDFNPEGDADDQNFSFLDVRTEYARRIDQKLSVRAYQQLYASSVVSQRKKA